jgi:hypothetical protein
LAAEAFVRQARHHIVPDELSPCMVQQLETISRSARSTLLDVRTPEGFAWYGLYPEAYVQAADQWAHRISAGARVLVVGIRRIGTTLAAVVSAALRERNLQTMDLTPTMPTRTARRCDGAVSMSRSCACSGCGSAREQMATGRRLEATNVSSLHQFRNEEAVLNMSGPSSGP